MGLIEPKYQCDKLLSKFLILIVAPNFVKEECVWNTQASINWTRGIRKSPYSATALQSWLVNPPGRGPNCLDLY